MNPYALSGLLLAIPIVVAYVGYAAYCRQTPQLSTAVEIFAVAAGMVEGIKILVFVTTGEFTRLIHLAEGSPVVHIKLSEEDCLFLSIGSIALIWITFERIGRQFVELHKKRPLPTSPTATPAEPREA